MVDLLLRAAPPDVMDAFSKIEWQARKPYVRNTNGNDIIAAFIGLGRRAQGVRYPKRVSAIDAQHGQVRWSGTGQINHRQ